MGLTGRAAGQAGGHLHLPTGCCCPPQPATVAARPSSMSWIRRGVLSVSFALVTAVAGCSSPPRCPPGASCPAIAPKLIFTPTINGKPAVPSKDGHVPRYLVRPGANLVMHVRVTVPPDVTVTALWFGISTGTWGNGPQGRPVGMNPILAHYHQPLPAGSHTFSLHWHIPKHRSAASLYLVYAWSSPQPPVSAAGPIATLLPA